MTAPPDLKNLELSVSNFGPIARANIDLRPMTVFVGPSNTGKSYLAILIYALHGFFSGRVIRPAFHSVYGNRTIFSIRTSLLDDQPVSREDIGVLTDWLEETLSKAGSEDSLKDVSVVLPEPVAKLVRPWLELVGDYDKILDGEIARCFGVDDSSSLVRNRVKSGGELSVKRAFLDTDTVPHSFTYAFTIKGESRVFESSIPIDAPLWFVAREHRYTDVIAPLNWLRHTARDDQEDERRYIANALLGELAGTLGPYIASPLSRAAHYLPADRTGVMHAHRVVVGSIIGQASRAGFQRDTPLPPLSGVLADFLEQLIGLGDQRERSPKGTLARQIEEDILQGEVRTEKSLVGYPEFFYRPDGWTDDLRLMNTSSMVSELAPVVLYIRHVVRPGELLIIEEPESHLHPAMQVEFIRHLAAAVNAGVRIMLTTHSEWVLDELANLVYLSDLPESDRRGIGGSDYALSPDEVGVWLFEPKRRPKGSVVKEIPFNTEYGGFASDFNEVAMGTYNDFAGISNRIEHRKAK